MNNPSTRGTIPTLLCLIAALGAFAVFFSVVPAIAAGGAGAGDDDAKVLTKLDTDWSTSAASRDADRVAAFYAEDASLYPPNEPLSSGRAAAKKVWAGYFADPNFTSITWKTAHAEAAKSSDLGYTAGTYTMTVKGPDGKPIIEKGKYVCIWKKQRDGNWKAIQDIWNSDAK